MNLNTLFNDLSESVVKPPSDPVEEGSAGFLKMPIKDSATLNQLLYKNEKYNKRDIPTNADKKPLHELIRHTTTTMAELNDMIENDINNLLTKAWFQIPIKLKKDLIKDYCDKNEVELSDKVMSKVLRDRTLVKYNRKGCYIETIKV
jgi:hypothetical protein